MTCFVHLGLGWIGDRGGGLERYQHGICASHASMGVCTSALVQSRTDVVEETGYPVIRFASLDDVRRDRHKKLRQQMKYCLRDRSDTAFVSHHASVSYHVLDLLRRHDHVVHFHGPWAGEAAVEGASRWKTELQKYQERRVYKSAARIVTLSKVFKELVVSSYGVDANRVYVVPGGINAAAADPGVTRAEGRARLGWPTDRPILLSIRRLCRRVGVDVMIDAMKVLVKEFPDLLLMVGGTGPLANVLQEQVKKLGLSDHVRLLGFVANEDLSVAYRAADFSVIPTQALEGFGLVTLESMAAGTPCIVTPVGSLPEVMNPISQSLVLPGKDAFSISEGVGQILRGSLSIPSAERCKSYVRENFDWSVISPRVLDVYRGNVQS